jgi:hypothetical protein
MPTTFQDDLETVNVSRLRASGAITADASSVVVSFGQDDDALRREFRVVHCQVSEQRRLGAFSFVLFAADRPRWAGVSAKRAIVRP